MSKNWKWRYCAASALIIIGAILASATVQVDEGDQICFYEITGKTCYTKTMTFEFGGPVNG